MACSTSGSPATPPLAVVQAVQPSNVSYPVPTLPALSGFDGAPDIPTVEPAPPPDAPNAPSAPSAPTIAFLSGDAGGIVSGVMSQAGATASASQAQALAILNSLTNYTMSFTPITAPAMPSGGDVIPAPLGTPPTSSALTPAFPTAPTAPQLADTPLVDLADPPAYAVPDVTIIDIALPDPFDALLPTAPDLATIPLAVEPDFTLPDAPTLLSLALPEAPQIILPLLDADIGQAPDAPDTAFTYAEAAYQTALLSTMTERLAGMVEDMDDTGLTQQVEQGIWERAAEREALLTHRAAGEALRLMKARGFTMPESAMVRTVQQALQGGLRRAASVQRDVLIKQAQLRQQNFKFATEAMVTLQSRLLDLSNAAQTRSLQAAKAVVSTEIALFNGQVQLYNASVSAFATSAQVFRARLDGALATIEVYKAQLSGQELIGDINVQKSAIYKEQIAGVTLIANTYKTRVDAARQVAESNKVIVDAYRSRVSALEAQVQAKATEYDMYSARIKGQAAKVAIYAGQNRAYGARVQAFDSLVRAKIGVHDLRFKQANEFPLELYKTSMDAYRIGSEAAVEKLRATASLFDSQVRAFSAQEGAKAANVEAQVRAATVNAQSAVAKAELGVEAGRINLQLFNQSSASAMSSMRAIGQVAGQMAAAAVSAQHVHASITESGLQSTSNTTSTSVNASQSTSVLSATATNVTNSNSTNVSSGSSTSNSFNTTESRSTHKGASANTSQRTSVSNSQRVSAHNSTVVSSDVSSSVNVAFACEDITTVSE